MKKKALYSILLVIYAAMFTGCYNLKQSPFYDSEWIMNNLDQNNNSYYHHLILKPDHKVMLRSSYYDSTNIIVWRGTYKINSRKIDFNFEDCSRFENGENVGQYSDKRLVKFYTGEYLYSVGNVSGSEENPEYHLMLVRPKNQIYGETKDIYGNYFGEFIKVSHLQ